MNGGEEVVNGVLFVNQKQAAELCGVERHTVAGWIRQGHLPAKRVGNRSIKIKVSDLEGMGKRIPHWRKRINTSN